jgi:MATE family multidrug resistance protein
MIGTTQLAAHQIALQIAAIVFMVPFGISMAATVRVGHAVGRSDPSGTRRAGYAAIALGGAFMIAMVVLIAASRHVLPLVFVGGDSQGSEETIANAAGLLLIGAMDGLQTVTAGALRGLNDTRIPMIIAAVSFWLIGFVACYALAFPLHLGVDGVWIGFTISLTVYSALLLWRFEALTRRGFMPAMVPSPSH